MREGASGARGRDAEPVAVGVFEITLPSGKALVIDRNPELLRDRVDVAYVQMNERVGTSVAFVFGEVEPDASSRHGDEPRKPRLELVLPLLVESESLVPGDSPSGVLDVQNRNDFFVQASLRLSGSCALEALSVGLVAAL